MLHYIIVFLISMVPLIELRGAIPYAVGVNNLGTSSRARYSNGARIKSSSANSSPSVWKKVKRAVKNCRQKPAEVCLSR